MFQFTGTVLIQGTSVKINGFREADPSFLIFFVPYKKVIKILVVYSKKIESV
jgi:hypothetical protein